MLAAAHRRHPANREILEALASFSAKAGERQAAIGYAEELLLIAPENSEAKALLQNLRGAAPEPFDPPALSPRTRRTPKATSTARQKSGSSASTGSGSRSRGHRRRESDAARPGAEL